MTRRADAKYNITAEDKTARAFRAVNQRLKRFKSNAVKASAAFLGLFAAGRIFSGMKEAARNTDGIAKAARRLDVGVGFMSRLAFAAELAGNNLSELETGIRNASKNVAEAAAGNKTYEKWLKLIGLRTEDVVNLDAGTRFLTIATALGKVQNQALKTAAAQSLLGRAGGRLLPLTDQIATDLNAVAASAEEAGAVIGEKTAADAETFVDQLTILNEQIEQLHRRLVSMATDNNLLEGLGHIAQLFGTVAGAVLKTGRFLGEAAAFGVTRSQTAAQSAGAAARQRLRPDPTTREQQKTNQKLDKMITVMERGRLVGGGAQFE